MKKEKKPAGGCSAERARFGGKLLSLVSHRSINTVLSTMNGEESKPRRVINFHLSLTQHRGQPIKTLSFYGFYIKYRF